MTDSRKWCHCGHAGDAHRMTDCFAPGCECFCFVEACECGHPENRHSMSGKCFDDFCDCPGFIAAKEVSEPGGDQAPLPSATTPPGSLTAPAELEGYLNLIGNSLADTSYRLERFREYARDARPELDTTLLLIAVKIEAAERLLENAAVMAGATR